MKFSGITDCYLCQVRNFSAISSREQVAFQRNDDNARFLGF
jgi:hypothetical protein